MREELAELAGRASRWNGRYGIVVHDLGSDEHVAVGDPGPYTSASVIKLPIMMTVLARVEAGKLGLTDRLPVAEEHRVDGSGIIGDLTDLRDLTVRDLIRAMISLSDNTATNVLIAAVGMDAVNAWSAARGLPTAHLARAMFDFDARARGLENRIGPDDAARLLTALARGDLAAPELTDLALHALSRQRFADMLPRYLPPDVHIAHKTGDLPGIRHDTGLITIPGRPPIAMAAMTEGFTGPDAEGEYGGPASDLIAEAARLVVSHYR